MIKTQLGLGVLSFPSVFDTLGLIPGVILLCVIAGITTWSNYMVGTFKLNHRHVYGVDDVGEMLLGRVGKEILAVAFMGCTCPSTDSKFCPMLMRLAVYIMVTGSAMLSLSIAFNALSNHGVCTAGFVAVAFVLVFALSSIRTLARITWLAKIGVVAIISASTSLSSLVIVCLLTSLVLTVTIAVGIQERPPLAPQAGEWKSDYKLIGNPSFAEAIAAVSTLVFAYAGTGAFFPIVSEMRDPRQYPRALAVCQGVITVVFLIVGIVVYYYCGSYVASPALGSAGHNIKKVAYGLALPGLLCSGVLLAHVRL